MMALPSLHTLNRDIATTVDVYNYHQDDIFVMTDEEVNIGTAQWPSKEMIVSFSPGPRSCLRVDFVLVKGYRQTRLRRFFGGCVFIFLCAHFDALLFLVDHISAYLQLPVIVDQMNSRNARLNLF